MPPEKTDTQLRDDVEDELRREPGVDAAEVGVAVDRGVVTLYGHVPDAGHRRLAEVAAERVPGVRAVVVDLDVRPPGHFVRDGSRMARAALHGLDWGAFVPGDRIKVAVHDGIVRLEGVVDWAHERDAAEAAVRDIPYVRAVDNAIVVKSSVTPRGGGDGKVRTGRDAATRVAIGS